MQSFNSHLPLTHGSYHLTGPVVAMEFPGEPMAFLHFSSAGFEQSHGPACRRSGLRVAGRFVTLVEIHKLLDGQTDSCVRYISSFITQIAFIALANLNFFLDLFFDKERNGGLSV